MSIVLDNRIYRLNRRLIKHMEKCKKTNRNYKLLCILETFNDEFYFFKWGYSLNTDEPTVPQIDLETVDYSNNLNITVEKEEGFNLPLLVVGALIETVRRGLSAKGVVFLENERKTKIYLENIDG